MREQERRPWPHDPRYLVGADGSIIGPSGRVLRPFIDRHGYRRFNRYADRRHSQHSVHVAVCEAFHGARPAGMWAAHSNGDRLDNRAGNLRWATGVENEADKIAHDTRAWGERHGMRKLTADDVRAIRASGAGSYVLARRYPVSPSMIRRIRAGKNWTHV